MSLKLHSNQYPNHLQIPRIHKIAETRLIPLSTRGGEGEGSGETNVVVAAKFLHYCTQYSIACCKVKSARQQRIQLQIGYLFSLLLTKTNGYRETSVHAHNLSQAQKMRSWQLGFQWVLRRVPEISTRRQTSWKNTITTTQKRGFRDSWVGWVDKGRSWWEQKSRDRYHAAAQIQQQQQMRLIPYCQDEEQVPQNQLLFWRSKQSKRATGEILGSGLGEEGSIQTA